jgi:hypothetical protein
MSTPTDLSTDAGLEGIVNQAIDAIAAAEGALARAAGAFPNVGTCAIRAVIDVERGNLKASRRHMLAARTALGTVGGKRS